jgi:predicted permease
MAFGFMVTFVTGILFGVAPALRNARLDLPRLRQGTRQQTLGQGARSLQEILVVAEVVFAMLLLTSAGLVIRSFQNLQEVDLGFRSEGLLSLRLSLAPSIFPERAERVAFAERVLEGIRALPGIEAAGVTTDLPASTRPFTFLFTVEGHSSRPSDSPPMAQGRIISPGYLEAMGIRCLEGRTIATSDRADTSGVSVISAEMAHRYWPDENPLGRRLKRGGPDSENPWLTVVGIVDDVRDLGPGADIVPALYLPYTQQDFKVFSVVLRTSGDPLAFAPAARDQVRAVDRNQPVYQVATMEQLLSESLVKNRFSALLLGGLSLVVLFLAAGGIYGVISYIVSRRMREIGIRTALGATLRDVTLMVLRKGMGLVLLGLLFGRAGGIASTLWLSNLLYRIRPNDPLNLAMIALLLVVVALIAVYLPARKATRVDPMRVLRQE